MDPIYLGIDKKSNRESKREQEDERVWSSVKREEKAKFIYGVLEKPFRNYYEKAARMKGQTGENLMIDSGKSDWDNVLFRMGFGRTRKETRQIVDHKYV